jgi:short-subunit dehydrogenase involved in D-alanine esterification of teichoic acids
VRTLVITGSTRGIGLGLACALRDEGCSVAVSGRHAQRLEEVHAEPHYLSRLGSPTTTRGLP